MFPCARPPPVPTTNVRATFPDKRRFDRLQLLASRDLHRRLSQSELFHALVSLADEHHEELLSLVPD